MTQLRSEFAREGIVVVEQAALCEPFKPDAFRLRLYERTVYEKCSTTGCELLEELPSGTAEERRALVSHLVEVLRPRTTAWGSAPRPLEPPAEAAASQWAFALGARAGVGPLPMRVGIGGEFQAYYALGADWRLGATGAWVPATAGTEVAIARVQLTHVPLTVGLERRLTSHLYAGAFLGLSALRAEGENKTNFISQSGWAAVPRFELRANVELLRGKTAALYTGLRAGLPLQGAELGLQLSSGYAAQGHVDGIDVGYAAGVVFF